MRDEGFTLIELLVSLAIMGLMAVLMSEGVSFGVQVWNRTQIIDQRIETSPRVERFLKGHLSHIYPFTILPQLPEFAGNPDSITYVAPALPQMALPGHYRYRLDVDKGDLMFSWCHLDICTTQNKFIALAETSVLMAVDKFFVWYGQRHKGDIQWAPTWLKKNRLPDFIKIRIKDRESEFTTVIQLRVDHDSRCIFDPVSQNCRDT